MEHLSLEIFDLTGTGSKYATLPEDTSITITDTSEIFASGDVWSHSFTLNVNANAHIFGSSGELHGSRLHEQINKRRARLWVEGLPIYLGYLRLEDEVDVDDDGNVDVSFESGQKTFGDLIEGAKANQVPMIGDVQFGIALWRKRMVKYKTRLLARVKLADGRYVEGVNVFDLGANYATIQVDGDNEETPAQQYPRMIYPKGRFFNEVKKEWEDKNYLNTDYPYMEDENGTPVHPYCNITLCYQRYGYRKENERGDEIMDYSSEPEAERGYEVMPANRVNSAPNFFVGYWIRALMKHLGIFIEENQMMNVEDLRRLFFVNTKCAYVVPKELRNAADYSRFEKYTRSRQGLTDDGYVAEYFDQISFTPKECGFTGMDWQVELTGDTSQFTEDEKTITSINIDAVRYKENDEEKTQRIEEYLSNNRLWHNAFATSDCFPDTDIADVINALKAGFGVRFLFDGNYQRVRIVLLRNIYRNTDVQRLDCDISSSTKKENNIRGFRMTYGNSEDTHFFYKGFNDKLPHKKQLWPDDSDTHDYSQWQLNAIYSNIIQKVAAFDKTCYVTPNTGNAFGVKVDQNAKRYDELHQAIFEFAGFMDAEDGDCTGEEETIEQVNVNFTPAIMNDLNMEQERQGVFDQQFALFVDEKMRPRRINYKKDVDVDFNDSDAEYDVDALYNLKEGMHDGIVKPGEFAIQSDAYAAKENMMARFSRTKGPSFVPTGPRISFGVTMNIEGHINEGYRLYLQDNYEPNDDGVSPIETHDWGLMLGILRGSGSDAYVDYKYDPNDSEGNDTWDITSGSNITAHPDTCDTYGNEWNYDGKAVVIDSSASALRVMAELFPDSNISLTNRDSGNYISGIYLYQFYVPDGDFVRLRSIMFAESLGGNSQNKTYIGNIKDYAIKFKGMTAAEMKTYDAGPEGFGILIDTDGTEEKKLTLLELQRRAFLAGENDTPMYIDNGVGSRYGRVSLKLRSEKPNPFYNPALPESADNRRYLQTTNKNLQGRGLADQFYKEHSYFIRNSRIAIFRVSVGIAQLLALDKTVRVTVGDVTGFIRKMQYTVSNKTGMGMVDMEILYI